jgi:hypothetical protein
VAADQPADLSIGRAAHGGRVIRDGHGERWLSIQPNTPVVYEDWAGMAPGCEPARVSGFVKRVELRLLSPEPKLLVFLEPHPDAENLPIPGWSDPRGAWHPADHSMDENPDECWGEFATNVEMKHAACHRCGWLHSYVADGPNPPRPHRRV